MADAEVPESVLRWAAKCVGGDAVVAAVRGLRSGRPPWLLHIESGGREAVRAVLKSGREVQPEIRTEVAALRVAAAHQLAVPRVIGADVAGVAAGAPSVLMTFLEGDARIPLDADPVRLRAVGAAAAAIHRVPCAPSAELPVRGRHMPWIDFADERRRRAMPTTPLLDAADERLRRLVDRPHRSAPVLVHGDLWAGNMLFRGHEHIATIDWEAAGVGHAGVDLGSLRLDAALMHEPGAADEVSRGWAEAFGRQPDDLARWDVVAALNTPADLVDLVPTLPEAGRPDLDGPTLTARRDAFLAAAVRALG